MGTTKRVVYDIRLSVNEIADMIDEGVTYSTSKDGEEFEISVDDLALDYEKTLQEITNHIKWRRE